MKRTVTTGIEATLRSNKGLQADGRASLLFRSRGRAPIVGWEDGAAAQLLERPPLKPKVVRWSRRLL